MITYLFRSNPNPSAPEHSSPGALPGDMAQETQQGKKQIISGDTTLAQKLYTPFIDYF